MGKKDDSDTKRGTINLNLEDKILSPNTAFP